MDEIAKEYDVIVLGTGMLTFCREEALGIIAIAS